MGAKPLRRVSTVEKGLVWHARRKMYLHYPPAIRTCDGHAGYSDRDPHLTEHYGRPVGEPCDRPFGPSHRCVGLEGDLTVFFERIPEVQDRRLTARVPVVRFAADQKGTCAGGEQLRDTVAVARLRPVHQVAQQLFNIGRPVHEGIHYRRGRSRRPC